MKNHSMQRGVYLLTINYGNRVISKKLLVE